MTAIDAAIQLVRNNRDRYLDEYKEFLSIPSISTLSQHKPDMQRAAEWVAAQLRGMGLDHVQILPTGGHPVVYADWLHTPGKPTILVYGHYDVQPVDPVNEWVSGPFEPTIRGDDLYARGASDMKGQVHAHLKATEAMLQTGTLGVNLKYLIEGEEEIGSPHLEAFIVEQAALLRCDVALNNDSNILKPDLPSIVYGLRGLAYFELQVQGPTHDLHSGMFGGAVHNPAQVLCELIAGMHDREGSVTLPGYYDKVRTLTPEERAELARTPYGEAEILKASGAPQLAGETGYTPTERIGARPTLEVNGLLSGFTGEGSKTVLPARAMAKISMRLVPQQDPEEVHSQLNAYLEQHAPPSVTWELRNLVHGPAIIVERDSGPTRAAAAALKTVFGTDPVFTLQGGSVPIVSMIKDRLGVDSVLLGFGLQDDNIHGPNEKQHLPNYFRGIESYIHFMANMAAG